MRVVGRDLDTISEKEFQAIFYNSGYYNLLMDLEWLNDLQINSKVTIFRKGEHGDYFDFGKIIKISKLFYYVESEYNCIARFRKKDGKLVTKYPADTGPFIVEPQNWMSNINEERTKRIRRENHEEYETNKHNKAWLEWAHYI